MKLFWISLKIWAHERDNFESAFEIFVHQTLFFSSQSIFHLIYSTPNSLFWNAIKFLDSILFQLKFIIISFKCLNIFMCHFTSITFFTFLENHIKLSYCSCNLHDVPKHRYATISLYYFCLYSPFLFYFNLCIDFILSLSLLPNALRILFVCFFLLFQNW